MRPCALKLATASRSTEARDLPSSAARASSHWMSSSGKIGENASHRDIPISYHDIMATRFPAIPDAIRPGITAQPFFSAFFFFIASWKRSAQPGLISCSARTMRSSRRQHRG
jgi:hypothetical protein